MTTVAGPASRTQSDSRDLALRLSAASAPADRLTTLRQPLVGSAAGDDRFSVVVAGTLFGAWAEGATAVLDRFRAEGERCLPAIEGEFALAIWDAERETLLLVRDPVGITPLFYARAGDDLVAATSLADVVSQKGVPDALSVPALADHICHRWPDPAETFYEAARRVPSGHRLLFRRGTTDVRRYWHPAPPGQPVDWIYNGADRFDEALDQAVERAAGSGRTGIYLSGGLDSVSVAAVAADQAAKGTIASPLALSLVFPSGQANEEPVQREVARRLGLEHLLLPFDEAVGGDGLLQAALEASSEADTPVMNIWFPAYRSLAAKAVNAGCRTAVTGGGGDEWLGVSPLLAADFMRRGDLAGLFRLWRHTSRSFRLSPTATLRNMLWTFGGKPILADLAERHAPSLLARHRVRRRQGLTPAWVAPDPSLRATLTERLEAGAPGHRHGSFYLREGHISLDHALMSMEMEEIFDSGRKTGLPVRMPYWDAQLVDVLYRTPPAALNEGGRSKGLVRTMLARRFPDLEFERQRKVLATSFFADTLEGQIRSAWQRLGGLESLTGLGIVDEMALHSELNDIFRERQHREIGRLWNLLSLEAWVRGRSKAEGG